MSKLPQEYLKHILDECKFIQSELNLNISNESFLKDEKLKRAVVRSLEIIGEASKKIPVDFKLKWNQVEWKSIAGMRDRLIHDYMGVNYTIVWDVAKHKIPELVVQISAIIETDNLG